MFKIKVDGEFAIIKNIMKRWSLPFSQFLFALGVLLIGANLYGLSTSLRSPDLMNDMNNLMKIDKLVSEDQIYSVIQLPVIDKKTYVRELNSIINKGIVHYWEDEGVEKYNLRVPFQENYLLFLSGYIFPSKFYKYEFFDIHSAIERGVGLCSEHSIIMATVLNEKGIKAKMVGLSGHVIVTAQVDEAEDQWWVLDPDNGVVIPYSMNEIEADPMIIEPYYLQAGFDKSTIKNLADIYEKNGNIRYKGYGVGDYSLLLQYFEKAAFLLVWVIPVLLMFPLIFRYSRRT